MNIQSEPKAMDRFEDASLFDIKPLISAAESAAQEDDDQALEDEIASLKVDVGRLISLSKHSR